MSFQLASEMLKLDSEHIFTQNLNCTFFVCGVNVGGEGEGLMSLMSEVSVSSDSLVLAALVLPGFFSVGFLEEDTDALFFEVTLCFETCLTSSNSLSESVSTNCLDLLVLLLARGLAVADFFGTTLGFWGEGFFDADDFFLEAGVSDSSSLIGRGFALALVTNPDLELDVETNPDFAFFTTFCFFLFFSAEEGSSFFLGLLAGLLCKRSKYEP